MKKKIIKIMVCIMCMVMVGVSMVIVPSALEEVGGVTAAGYHVGDAVGQKIMLKMIANTNLPYYSMFDDYGAYYVKFDMTDTFIDNTLNPEKYFYVVFDYERLANGNDPTICLRGRELILNYMVGRSEVEPHDPIACLSVYLDGEEIFCVEKHVFSENPEASYIRLINCYSGIDSYFYNNEHFDMTLYVNMARLTDMTGEIAYNQGRGGFAGFCNMFDSCRITAPESYNIGVNDGKKQGYDGGYNDGYGDGEQAGYQIGMNDGISQGYSEGQLAGYDQGYAQGNNDGYLFGLEEGYSTGYDEGHVVGYDEGYKIGFPKGQEDMGKTMESFKDMVFAVFDAPSRLIDSMLNFDIFGINMAGLVKTLITLAVVGLIVFAIWKLKG